MERRSMILFPSFPNRHAVQAIRERYDPLAHCIAPHITVVFPFESSLTTKELARHMQKALKGIRRFPVMLEGFAGEAGEGCLFLPVKQGSDRITQVHDRLYTGPFAPFLCKTKAYLPHLTVGRLGEQAAFSMALAELGARKDRFETVISKVYLERMDDRENSIIEFVHDLEG